MDISAFVRVRTLRNALIAAGSPENEASELCIRTVLTLMCEAASFFLGKPFTALIIGTQADDLPQKLEEFLASLPFLRGQKAVKFPDRNSSELKERLISTAALNWLSVSPDLLGSFYEYGLSRETQNSSGIFYTSKDNIHRVIDHLFIDTMYEELESALGSKEQLLALNDKLSGMTFLDAACGGGNFLVETLAFLRSFETELAVALQELGVEMKRKVSYGRQVFGIEYDIGAAECARYALMIQNRISDFRQADRTDGVLSSPTIADGSNIVTGDSLLINWHTAAGNKISFVFGNPPFVYKKSSEQLEGMELIFDEGTDCSALDYCAAWLRKASFICAEGTKCAFLTTSSICQGEQAAILWNQVFSERTDIDFAFRPFIWVGDVDMFTDRVQTYCVIVGFSSARPNKHKQIFETAPSYDRCIEAKNINAYLLDLPNVLIYPADRSLSGLSEMLNTKNYPDGITEAEYLQMLREGRAVDEYIPYIHARDSLYGKRLVCKVPIAEQKPPTNYICIPRTSSIKRAYIPIMFFRNSRLAFNEGVHYIPNADPFLFGLLCSSMHNAWTKLTCGRLANNLRYSIRYCYNTFPVPICSQQQRKAISQAATNILEIRSKKLGKALAELYDEMPIDLRTAHMKLDFHVDRLYSPASFIDEKQRLDTLIRLYEERRTDNGHT